MKEFKCKASEFCQKVLACMAADMAAGIRFTKSDRYREFYGTDPKNKTDLKRLAVVELCIPSEDEFGIFSRHAQASVKSASRCLTANLSRRQASDLYYHILELITTMGLARLVDTRQALLSLEYESR